MFTISCKFACHNKRKHICALRTAYSVARLQHFYTISLQYEATLLNLHIVDVFKMWDFSFLQRTYNLYEKETKNVSLYLDDNLIRQVKIEAPSGRALLNDIVFHSGNKIEG